MIGAFFVFKETRCESTRSLRCHCVYSQQEEKDHASCSLLVSMNPLWKVVGCAAVLCITLHSQDSIESTPWHLEYDYKILESYMRGI